MIKDVHTEHCCYDHGCKYGEDDCPVVNKQKSQSFPCEDCRYSDKVTADPRKSEFVDQFTVHFLATHAANIYQDACMTGKHERLDAENLPLEDAKHIANEAWKAFENEK